jgi:glycosyltransferase involved in cell wall biosynthesis
MPLISVVIPVYMGASCLNELYRRLVASLETISPDFEILLVEDCGGDGAWPMIQALGAQDKRVIGIQFSRNFGQHYGITAGMDHSLGDWVVVMDGDLQDQPEEIPRLYAKALEGFDIVIARRQHRQHSLWKRVTAWMFYRVFNYLSGFEYDGRIANFRIMSRVVVWNFLQMREHLRFFSALVSWMGFPVATIDITHAERHSGESTYTLRKLLKLAGETIITYSDKPLWLCISLGFTLAFVSFLGGAFIFIRAWFFGSPVMGWSSLFVSLYFMGGIIISILGVIGIYLGKTFQETKKRPLYIIRQACNLTLVEGKRQ